MLEAKLAQGLIIKKIVESLKGLVNIVNFNCRDNGIQAQVMDSMHSALISLLLKSKGFETYRCDRHIKLGIPLEALSKILKFSGDDDSITLKAGDNAKILGLTFSSQNGSRSSESDLHIFDVNAGNYDIPDIKYDTIVSMSSAELFKICSDLSSFSYVAVIEVTKASVRFSASGGFGNYSVYLKHDSSINDDDVKTTIRCSEPITLKFSVKYLSHFTKAAPLSSLVTLNISEGAPMLIEYIINDMGYLQCSLAPITDNK